MEGPVNKRTGRGLACMYLEGEEDVDADADALMLCFEVGAEEGVDEAVEVGDRDAVAL